MPKIVVGEGQVMALLEVPSVPQDGEIITIEEDQLISGATDSVELLIGDRFLVKRAGTIQVEGEEVPRFGIENMKSVNLSL